MVPGRKQNIKKSITAKFRGYALLFVSVFRRASGRRGGYRILAKNVMIAALKKSMNSEPTSGTIMNATGAGP